MAKVTFKHNTQEIEVEKHTSLVDVIRGSGLPIETPCDGKGSCGKCKVRVIGILTSITEQERDHIDIKHNERLACVTNILGDIEIELSDKKLDLKTINTGYAVDINIDSDIEIIELPDINNESCNPYIESLTSNVAYTVLEKISNMDKSTLVSRLGVVYNNKIIDIIKNQSKILGVAIDIGTTGVSIHLIDLSTGEILNKKSSLNPQTDYGGDVLSRISYSMNNSDGKENLQKVIVDKINEIILELVENKECIKKIYRVSISANTVMLHMLLGLDTQSISRAPYRPEFLKKLDIKAEDIGIKINEEGVATILPSVSAYVGADIVSGAIAIGFNKKKHNSILIDIGTNGEILAISNGEIAGTSTAAGPAFEGMNISCGCRAEPGAIDTFKIIDDQIIFTTIDKKEVRGICGSGLIDIVSELIRHKIILKSGRFNNKLEDKLNLGLRDKKFYITDNIYISQKDIRQVQLAKGAISAGVIMLLSNMNLSINDIGEVVIAGAFGYHLNPESIKTMGIIPKGFTGDINFVGNSSIEGARLSLINKKILNDMMTLKNEIKVLELSMSQDFQDCFIKELNF